MDQRVSLITLGAQNVETLSGFYDALGWSRVETQDGVVAYDLIAQTLGLYPLASLAEDIGIPVESLGRGAATLGCNVAVKESVTEVLLRVEGAGGKVLKPTTDVFWGGHHGYFADPEGHIWEVAFNPFSPLGPNGEFQWNGYT